MMLWPDRGYARYVVWGAWPDGTIAHTYGDQSKGIPSIPELPTHLQMGGIVLLDLRQPSCWEMFKAWLSRIRGEDREG